MKSRPQFMALLTFAPATESTLSTPVSSGFRSKIVFSDWQTIFTAMHDFGEIELVFSGDVVTASITLFDATPITDKIYKGLDFDFFEGENPIGHGVVTKIL